MYILRIRDKQKSSCFLTDFFPQIYIDIMGDINQTFNILLLYNTRAETDIGLSFIILPLYHLNLKLLKR